MELDPSSLADSVEYRRWRMKRESAWQYHAAPLAIVRELREALIAEMILNRRLDVDRLKPLLELEAELLSKAYAHDWRGTLQLLNANHGRSWSEMVSWLKDNRRLVLAVKIEAFVGILRPAIEEIYRELERDD